MNLVELTATVQVPKKEGESKAALTKFYVNADDIVAILPHMESPRKISSILHFRIHDDGGLATVACTESPAQVAHLLTEASGGTIVRKQTTAR